jgi:LmbE family N-acetylglucosaminyl deacetylase
VEALADLLRRARPEVVYTHNLADKHDTHVSVALATIDACRSLPADQRPRRLLGGEGWRDLDWLTGDDKVALDVSARESLSAALIGVFDSQITGGKRYDLAVAGLRRAHATLDESHHLDASTALAFYMDLTPLVTDTARDPLAFAQERVERFATDVKDRIRRLRGPENRSRQS